MNPARTAAQLRLAALWRWPSDRANLALSSTPLRGHGCQPRGGTAGIRIAGVRELRNGACFNPVVAVATPGRLQPPVARATALARTTSGSRGSGGTTSCQRCSRRTRGRRIRICCTVSHLPSGNGTDPGCHGASPEGGGRVEFLRAAIGHPKVLPVRRGDGGRESGPVAGPGDGLGAVGGAPRSDTNPHSSRPRRRLHPVYQSRAG